MKFTLGWLKEHLDTNASLTEIVAKLTSLGLEVERVEDRAATFAPFAVAYVEKAEKHPDADRLRVCVVDTGKEKLQVVCGAPNARAGMKGVFAPAGSYVPGTGMTLKKGVIRGQESNGMLVSEREMGVSEEGEGIIEVPGDVAVGTPFAALYGLDDPVIEINLTPNRADCAGVRGIARDLAAAGLGKLKPLDEKPIKGSFDSKIKVHFQFDSTDADACPLFIGRYIRGVKNGPSPDWMQKRLKAIGLRPISALVDITNYLSYDLCRPLHVFDADKIRGDLRLRPSKKGETFRGLDEKDYMLDDGMTAICDDSGVINMAGVMGGESTGCSSDTVNVYLEVAYFSPERTARAGRKLGINSDARYRFERGIDPAFTIPAAEIATKMILDLCGGEASSIIKAGDVPTWQRSIPYDPSYVNQLAGFAVDEKKQKDILSALGFEIGKNEIQPPSWRADVEGRADIVEEIVRITGYESIPATSLRNPHAITQSGETPAITTARHARTALAGRGLNECVTWSFMPSHLAEKFGGNDNQSAAALRLSNPISADLDQMRPTPLPNLLEAAGRNAARGFSDTALFEVGPAFSTTKPNGQSLVAATLRHGHKGPRHWAGAEESRDADLFDAKADALAVLEACGAPASRLQVTRDAPGWYHPGRSGALRLGPNVLAYFGEIHPALREEMKIDAPVCGAEMFLDRVPAPKKSSGTAKPLLILSAFQPVARDFAFLVDRKLETSALVRAAQEADKNLIERVDIFDVYEGKGIDDGKKSVAINVVLQPYEQTLTDANIDAVCKKIIDFVAAKCGGQLRG